jgi:hypothetical protein
LLAVARSHLSVNQVCAMSDLPWAEIEAAIEDKLQSVLVRVSPEIHDYQRFHEKFREFIVALFSGRLSPEVTTRLNNHFVREAPPELRAEGEVAALRGRDHQRGTLWRAAFQSPARRVDRVGEQTLSATGPYE